MKTNSMVEQMAAGVALAAKRGEIDKNNLKGTSKHMYNSMSEKDLKNITTNKVPSSSYHKNYLSTEWSLIWYL